MYSKKNNDRRVNVKTQFNILGPMNYDQSVFLISSNSTENTSNKKLYMMKVIAINHENASQILGGQQAIIKKLFSSSLYYFKPEFYDFKDNSLCIIMKAQPLSLQNLIWIYKYQQKNFSSALIREFTVRNFQGIARLKHSDIFPQNLKPSNIFLQIRSIDDRAWLWSEAGLYTNKICQFYYKQKLDPNAKNRAKLDPFQMEFYSLGIIILEMITFQPPAEIDKIVRQGLNFYKLKNFQDAQNYYGQRLTNIITLLLNPPKDNSLQKAIQSYKESNQEQENEQPNYGRYQLNETKIDQFISIKLLDKKIEEAKQNITKKNISCRQIFDKLSTLDPQFAFAFSSMRQFEELLEFVGLSLTSQELIFLSSYYTSLSSIRYFKFLQRIIPAKEMIQSIILKAVQQYENNFKQFFEAQTAGKDFWKVQEIKKFLELMQTPFEQRQVVETVKQWTKGSKTSIKYNELYQIFKPLLGMSMSLSNLSTLKKNKDGEKDVDGGSCLIKILQKLKDKLQNVKNEDLLTFFRKEDIKCNWTVDSKIYKVIKNYVKDKQLNDQQIFRKGFLEMQIRGAIPGNISKDIQYVYLLRNLQVYEPLQLLRLILTQKINEDHRQAFFEKYKKQTTEYSGWTIESLKEFNQDEGLDFQQRQLRALFREMDSDNSGCIETRELFYKLTNIKEFDYELLIQNIKHTINKQGIYLFQMFQQADPRARLVLSNPNELKRIVERLDIEISQDHLTQFYGKFAKKNNFQYLVFLRQFYPKQKLFFSSIQFMLKEHYRNDFQKLFQMGLSQGKKKWNNRSLMLVNEQMVLGFRQIQLDQIWVVFDKNNELTLTKEQVASIFNVQLEKTTQLQRKTLENFKDFKPSNKQQKNDQFKNKQVKETKAKQQNESSIIHELKQLGDKKMIEMAVTMINQSETKNGKIQLQHCYFILQDGGVRSSKKIIIQLLNKFKQLQTKKITINLITFNFYLYDMIYSQDQSLRAKSKSIFLLTLIKEIKKIKSITNQNLFELCRKGNKMRLNDFQEIVRNIFEVEVYFQDLQQVWQCWGGPQYLTQEDFEKILQSKQFKQKVNRQNFKEKDKQRSFGAHQQQKNKKTVFSKLGQQNRMLKFSNQGQSNDSPKMSKPFSFNEKDEPTFRKMNSKRSESKNLQQQKQDTPISRFKLKNNTNDQKQKTPQTKNEPQKRMKYPSKNNKQQKIQLQQYQQLRKNKKEENDKNDKNAGNNKYTKNQMIQKFKQNMDQFGQEYMNELFSRANVIQSKRFIACLNIHYNFDEPQAIFLAQNIANFGKIKLDTIKGLLSKSPTKPSKEQYAQKKISKQRQVQRQRQHWDKSIQKKPMQFKKDNVKEDKKLIDPRKQKTNLPLVKEHIKSLLSIFSKRFQLSQLEPFFFGEKDHLTRAQFINKSQSINTSLSSNICQKIFDYFRPDNYDKVGVLSFKLGMGIDQHFDNAEDDENYLPQELQKELKIVFEKADKDHSGFIESNQIQYLLASLGFNENIKQIENYFARIDKNFDNKISYPEFRLFIQDQILPQLATFEQDEEELEQLLRDNDIFRQGSIAPPTFQAVIERYGIKLTTIQVQILIRTLNPQGHDININQFLIAMMDPKKLGGKAKAILYKIKLRKKIYLKQIQKIFQNISSCFVLAYTPSVILKELTSISTPFKPSLHQSGLFYNDLPIKDIRKIGQTEEGIVGGQIGKNDILVEILLKQVSGIPIPQKQQIKNNIFKRYLAISFFDLSSEIIKHAVWNVEAQWDPDQEDVWRFGNNVRSILIKIGGYEARKFQKIVVLFQLVISVIQGSKTMQINCGCANLPLRQLLIPQGKTSKKLKLIAGLPNRSKQIDKNSITKRGGWKNFFGGQIQSELQLQFIHQNKFKEQHRMIAALPSIFIIAKKSLNYLWTFRQILGQNAFEGTSLNPFLMTDIKVIVFLLTLDIPDLFSKIWLWWKQKIDPKIKMLSEGKKVFKVLMQDLYLIVNSKQFQLIKRCPSKPIFHNKPLQALRTKMIAEVFDNIQNWITTGIATSYKRKKNYNYNYGPLQIQQVSLPRQHREFLQTLVKLTAK